MRRIAREAACSHAAIFLYFASKDELLRAVAGPPLEELRERFALILDRRASAGRKLRLVSREFVAFCLARRTMYRVYFASNAARVDVRQEAGTLNEARIRLFELLAGLVRETLGLQEKDRRALQCSRIYFYMLLGIVSTYDQSEETTEVLLERLSPTFDAAFDVGVAGLRNFVNR